MKHRWPFLVLTLLLLALWLLLNETLALDHVLLGIALALASVLAYVRLQAPGRKRLRRVGAMLQLGGSVFVDVVRSNIAVARIVLMPGNRKSTSGFLDIPLELHDPAGLAVLACIITATPGTVWVRYDSMPRILTLHILDLIDENAWRKIIKGRYERRLLEIFE